MGLTDKYQLFIVGENGESIAIKRAEGFPDTRSKNQRRKDRKEYFKNKRKMRGSISFTIEKEMPWHERIIIKSVDKN
jgi:hypothetical protein